MIRFLLTKDCKPVKMYRHLWDWYGTGIMCESRVRQLCIEFKTGRTNVHDEDHSGKPTLVTDELVKKNNDKISENRRFMIT